jgi:hypothetical protein
MRSLGSLILSILILAAGAGGAYWFRKPDVIDVPLRPLHPPSSATTNDFRAVRPSSLSNAPVAAPLLNHPEPRLLGRIEEEKPETRPLGLAKDLPPNLPETFISNNGSFDGPPLDGLDP